VRGAAGDARAAQRAVVYRLHWVGASFEGLRLLELASAASQIIVFAAPDRARGAIAALRRVDEQAPTGDLAAPRYPRYYLAQLRSVHDAYARTASTRATHAELHISQSAVRFQLALADERGTARLRRGGVGADTTLQDVKRQGRQPTERGEQCALEPTTR
jgi:hypothetical protein